ncbi:hypothetical protein H5410_021659 [Solanum commersonii]|uniref:Uncharacterized protein n=1 Tax=Solanum commersonii TaxID=4109 RepID=A0A9J5ZCJ9_SOLCO|nr:hypothetical protein H5410_021659 [Solanum commersonii]
MMNQETCVTKRQKVKILNYVSAGSLASLRNKKSNKKYHKNKLNSNYSINESRVLEQVQQVSLNSTFPTVQIVHEKMQQLSPNFTTPVSQEQMQQRPQNSTNLEGNNQSEEQGKHI